MKFWRLFFSAFLLFGCSQKLYTDEQFFNCANTADFTIDSDKKQLIYWALQRAVVKNRDIPDYRMIKDKQKIFVENTLQTNFFKDTVNNELRKYEVPAAIDDVQFCLKSIAELQEIANRTSDFMYLSLGEVRIDTNYATIGIANSWMVSAKSMKAGEIYLAGGGYILKFYKMNGKWIYQEKAYSWSS